jgi:hypothetical protein
MVGPSPLPATVHTSNDLTFDLRALFFQAAKYNAGRPNAVSEAMQGQSQPFLRALIGIVFRLGKLPVVTA